MQTIDANMKGKIRAFAGEFLATFFFLFSIQGAAFLSNMINSVVIGGISLALSGMAVVATFGSISGAHFNPAVTFGALIGGRMNPITGVVYIILQVTAGILASLLQGWLYPGNYNDNGKKLVVQVPSDSNVGKALVMEIILTFILVFVVYSVALGLPTEEERQNGRTGGIVTKDDEAPSEEAVRGKGRYAALAIGTTLGFLGYIGGPTSGGGFNPARITGPAIAFWEMKDLWVYWLGGLIGATIAGGVWMSIFF